MKKNLRTISTRKDEAKAVLDGFIAVTHNHYGNYSFVAGYFESVLLELLAESATKEEYDAIMARLRKSTTDYFIGA